MQEAPLPSTKYDKPNCGVQSLFNVKYSTASGASESVYSLQRCQSLTLDNRPYKEQLSIIMESS